MATTQSHVHYLNASGYFQVTSGYFQVTSGIYNGFIEQTVNV